MLDNLNRPTIFIITIIKLDMNLFLFILDHVITVTT